MRKNNSSRLKPGNAHPANKRRGHRSTSSRKASSGNGMPSNASGAPRMSRGSLTWRKTLAANPEMAEAFQRAIDLFGAGETGDAIKSLEATLLKHPHHAPLWWYLGMLYRERKQLHRALDSFRKATQLEPRAKRASLGLFHTLWDLGQLDEALKEIKRYQLLTNWSCDDYRKIVAEINEKWVDPPKGRKKSTPRR